MQEQEDTRPLVVVVGAGFAGLSCAQTIRERGAGRYRVEIVEATEHLGGRCRQDPNFVPWKICELGAEFIHGHETSLMKLVERLGFPVLKIFTWAQGDGETPEYPVGGGMCGYWLGRERRFVRYDTTEEDVTYSNMCVWNLTEQEADLTDTRTLREYLADQGVSPLGMALVDAGYANTLCTTVEDVGLSEVVRLEQSWERFDGGCDYRMLNSFRDVINYLARDLTIKQTWPVRSIAYSKFGIESATNHQRSHASGPGSLEPRVIPRVRLTSESGEIMTADRVVLTASLQCLKQRTIDFQPPLPRNKSMALDRLNMFGAMKILMKFSRRFWPIELHGMICTDMFLPELWFDGARRAGHLMESFAQLEPVRVVDDGTFIVSGFACAAVYDRISRLPQEKIRDEMLKMCDEIFGNQDLSRMCPDPRLEKRGEFRPSEVNMPTPATDSFMDMRIQDWGKDPYVRGGYSSPSTRDGRVVRQTVAAPLADSVFFAGEHTNFEHYMSIHAAMESGVRAAREVLRSLGEAEMGETVDVEASRL